MKKTLFIIILLAIGIKGIGQKSEIKYTFLDNDPSNVPRTSINISPVRFEANGSNSILLGYSLGVETRIKKINMSFEFKRVYSEKAQLNQVSLDEAVNSQNNGLNPFDLNQKKRLIDFKPFREINFGISYIIKDVVAKKKQNVTLSSKNLGSYNYGDKTVTTTLVELLPIDVNVRKVTELRGGVMQYQTSTVLTENKNLIISEDGTEFYRRGVTFIGPTNNRYTYEPKEANGWATNIDATSFYIGISTSFIKNYAVDIENYGIRSSRFKSSFYADLFYSPSVNINNIQYFDHNNPGVIKEYNIKGEGKNKIGEIPFGFRIGCDFKSIYPSKIKKFTEKRNDKTSLFSIGYKLELGVRPSISLAKGFFADFGLYIPIIHIK